MTHPGRHHAFAKLTGCVALAVALASTATATTAAAAAPRRTALTFAATSATHGANHFVLRRAGADLQLLDTDTHTTLRSVPIARTSSVSITGATDVNNTLTLDFSGGSLRVPGGITYAGGRGGYNVLALRGGHARSEREVAYTRHSGLIVLGDTTIHYAQIAPINDTVASGTDTITGTTGADTINVVNGPSGTTQVNSSTFELVNFANKTSVTVNGDGGGDTFKVSATTAATGLTALTLDSSSGVVMPPLPPPSTFDVQTLPSGVSLSLVGRGDDTANLGAPTSGMQSILGPVTITDPPSFMAVDLNDSTNAASSRFVTVSSSGGNDTISGLAPSTITAHVADLQTLAITGGSVGNTFLLSPSGAGPKPLTLNPGAGVNSSFVQGVTSGGHLTINDHGAGDGVAIGNAGTVQGILGPVSLAATGAPVNVVLDDSSDAIPRTASMTTDGTTDTISGLAPVAITANANGLGNVTLNGGSGGNTLSVAAVGGGTGAGHAFTLNTGTGTDATTIQAVSAMTALTVNGQSGNDLVNLDNAASMQGISAPVVLTNGGATTLFANDSADTSARAVTVNGTSVTGLAPATITYSSVPSLIIDGGAPNDTFAVTPSATTTDNLVGGGPATATPPGNALTVSLTGATSPVLNATTSTAGAQGSWTFANRAPVNFLHMQSLNPTEMWVGDAATTVGSSGSAALSFMATLLAPSPVAVTASYATADGTASAAAGTYQPTTGTVTFPAGSSSQTIAVNALGSATAHPPETVSLVLSAPVNAMLGRAVGTGTITLVPTPPQSPPPIIPPPPAQPAPLLTKLAQTHTSWREGSKLAVVSKTKKRPVVGTTFSFSLNEAASVALTFTQTLRGRTVAGHCVTQTKKNAKAKACTHVVAAGPLRVAGHSGTNHVTFQGVLSRTTKLKTGRTTLSAVATNTAGQHSHPSTLTFTIVA